MRFFHSTRRTLVVCSSLLLIGVGVVATGLLMARPERGTSAVADGASRALLMAEARRIASDAQADHDRLVEDATRYDQMADAVIAQLDHATVDDLLPLAGQLGMYRGCAAGARDIAVQRAAMARDAYAVVEGTAPVPHVNQRPVAVPSHVAALSPQDEAYAALARAQARLMDQMRAARAPEQHRGQDAPTEEKP